MNVNQEWVLETTKNIIDFFENKIDKSMIVKI